MLFGLYFKCFTAFFMALLVSERIPVIKTIDPGSSGEASQLVSALNEFANGAKEIAVEMVTRPSDSLYANESNQCPTVPALSLPPQASPPLGLPPPSPPESIQPPEATSLTNSASRFWRVDGSKIILELDLEMFPGFHATRKVVAWVAQLFGEPYWLHALVPAALGFFGGLGYGFAGWCRWCLSRRDAPQTAEKVVVPKKTERRAPASVWFESRLDQSYMMPLNFQRLPDPRRWRVSVPIAATKSEQAEETNATIDRIAKKEEDADPLMVPSSLSDPSWYPPRSPLSPTQFGDEGFDLSSYDGFQPKPKRFHPDDLPDTLLGSFPPVASPPRPRKPSLPQISDPWSNYIPEDRVDLS